MPDDLARRFEEAMLEMAGYVWTHPESGEEWSQHERELYGMAFTSGGIVALVVLAQTEHLYELDDDLRAHPIRPDGWIFDPDEPDRDPGFERLMELVADDREDRRQIMLDAFLRGLQRREPEGGGS